MSVAQAPYEIYNGELVPSGSPLFTSSSRAFRYGDGLFESIKVISGMPNYFEDHFMRLTTGMKLLKLKPADDLSLTGLKNQIGRLLSANNCDSARVRITLFREGQGLYKPDSNGACWHISSSPDASSFFITTQPGLKLGLYDRDVKTTGEISTIKTLNSLVYVMGSLHAAENGFDDVFLLNTRGNIIESTNSNLFVVYQNAVVTPPVSEGCLDGVMRKNVIRIIREAGIQVNEVAVKENMVLEADELFLTNAIHGARLVGSFRTKNYQLNLTSKVNEWLNKEISLKLKN